MVTTAFHNHNFKTIPTGEIRVRQEGGAEECLQSVEFVGKGEYSMRVCV